MKKSINYWSFPGGLSGATDIPSAMRTAKEAGYEGIELCVGDTGALSLASTKADCARFVKQADEIGIEIASVASGIFWGYNFASPTAQERAKAVAATKKMLQITNWLGTDALLTIPGAVDVFFNPGAPVIASDVVQKRAAEGLRMVIPTAEKVGVTLAIEPVWNKLMYSPTELASFVDSFDSARVGVYMDVGNVMPFGYPEHWIRILGQRLARVHMKDFKRGVGTADGFCDLLEGDVNWPEVIKALKDIGYNSFLTAEMIPLYKHYPEVRIKNTSTALDAILGRR